MGGPRKGGGSEAVWRQALQKAGGCGSWRYPVAGGRDGGETPPAEQDLVSAFAFSPGRLISQSSSLKRR